ncbi:MAG: GDSL-type esterase/lipase family protein [Intestinibacter sp.]
MQIKQGVEAIKKLEDQDVVQVEEKIASVKAQNGITNEPVNNNDQGSSGKVNYKSKFASSVIVGDSRAEGISAYGFLTQSSVVAHKGRNILNAKEKGDISTTIGLCPKNIFFTYGINDIACYSDSTRFIEEYESIIDLVKSKLPNTNIYICSILPVQSFTLSKHPNFANIDKWNSDLQALCQKKGVTYLDANGIVEQSDYEQDGIHFKVNFQKKWMDFFIEKANL